MPVALTKVWRVLLVDDDSLVSDSIRRMLEFDQHRVTTAATVAEALSLSEKDAFDLFMLDYIMPEMRGDKLAITLRERFPEVPIIMVTADAEKVESPGGLPAGVDLLLGKPFRLDNLRAALNKVLVKT